MDKNSPLVAQGWDKELAYGGIQISERPNWMSDIFGMDVMRDEQAKALVKYWNAQDLNKIDSNSPAWSKFAVFASDPENQLALFSGGLAVKELVQKATAFLSRNSATSTVEASKIGLQWGKGNMKQGMPWEDFVGTTLPANSRLPQNFKTFDYYDRLSKTAISAKTLDTQTLAKLTKPNQLYSSIKSNVDAVAKFKPADLSGVTLTPAMIANREIRLAVPAQTNATQWLEINRAVEYGKTLGIKINITQVK
ncbi:hypothetical protein DLM_2330 [Aquitalea magnusonii]|uniref:Uncharacterized protein n=1 Tax=Aquitalea magnusonii TaxID=332411 RepID=A0A3G9GF03_9NEIS|nr:hypothetical protein [Aquitalea magnusonii]BBF85944.1 hypothetical protein DLM_2330 [Aquitalea magnusonii]